MRQQSFIFSDEKKYRLQRHLSFWIFWWIFFGVLYSYTPKISVFPNFQRLPVAMVESLFFLIPHMFLSYSLIYFVIPRFVVSGKYTKAAFSVISLFFITACISALIGMFVLPPLRGYLFATYEVYYPKAAFLNSLLAGLRGAITIGGLASAIKLMKYWYLKEQRNLQLQKENAEISLQLLKAQIHPHFLFNTLNNIYAHTHAISPVASAMITELSDLLRYILYECNQPLVALDKELQMIKDYISLEKIRYGNQLELHIDLPEKNNHLLIAPLLLLPLVENCFKHGTSKMLEQPWINLQVNIQDKQMQMKLINAKVNTTELIQHTPGIGIKNVQERLSLLYPGKHDLTITSEEDVFIINLKIELELKKDEFKKQKKFEEFA